MARWSAALLLLLSACAQPVTQLVVVVDSDLPEARLHAVRITARPVDDTTGMPTASETFTLSGTGPERRFALPLSLGVLPPGGDAARRVEIVATALDDAGAPVVTRTARTGFIPRSSLRLPMFLVDACVGVVCGPGFDCDLGDCVAIDLAPESLTAIAPGRELEDASVDAGAPRDAAREDAALEDAASDGPTDAGRASTCVPVAPTTWWTTLGDEAVLALSVTADPTEGVFRGLVAFASQTVLVESDVTLGSAPVTNVGVPTGATGLDLAPSVGPFSDGLFVHAIGTQLLVVALDGVTPSSFGSLSLDGRLPARSAVRLGADTWFGWDELTTGMFNVQPARTSGLGATIENVHPTAQNDHVTRLGAALLDVYDDGTTCSLLRVPLTGAIPVATELVATGDCSHPAARELSDGRVALVWSQALAGDNTVQYQLFTSALAPVGSHQGVGMNGAAGMPFVLGVEPHPTDGSFLIVWADPGTISYIRVGSDGNQGTPGTISSAPDTIAEYATLRTARLDDAVLVAWSAGTEVHVAVVCDPGPPPAP